MTIEQRVANGATFLDLHVVGWAERIDTNLLDLSSCHQCLLGQLFGEYTNGAKAVGMNRFSDWERLASMGFNLPSILMSQFDGLTAAWRDLILSRRASVAAPDQHGRGR